MDLNTFFNCNDFGIVTCFVHDPLCLITSSFINLPNSLTPDYNSIGFFNDNHIILFNLFDLKTISSFKLGSTLSFFLSSSHFSHLTFYKLSPLIKSFFHSFFISIFNRSHLHSIDHYNSCFHHLFLFRSFFPFSSIFYFNLFFFLLSFFSLDTLSSFPYFSGPFPSTFYYTFNLSACLSSNYFISSFSHHSSNISFTHHRLNSLYIINYFFNIFYNLFLQSARIYNYDFKSYYLSFSTTPFVSPLFLLYLIIFLLLNF